MIITLGIGHCAASVVLLLKVFLTLKKNKINVGLLLKCAFVFVYVKCVSTILRYYTIVCWIKKKECQKQLTAAGRSDSLPPFFRIVYLKKKCKVKPLQMLIDRLFTSGPFNPFIPLLHKHVLSNTHWRQESSGNWT